ncbi:SDR family oxidoreductase [Domibacillus sp. DTU_2020_1001157_1_SI_ALB_TIR_016]|uniref:SDR family oxidoreductase n=1 Tax=Domibacillus sp. DTU_2020_1001157_1_SI_ALB_TIR_016 TaxID=3077789 RepID=UPI0028E3E800|nr:SDR family oxidoreductase [Domibacillus sp. DTU_2020_1001157_1_SI_ALB_TIR_016]WNS82172.1 SDR family oxidoreductase [Domibacillus sp. DTU_2020_1001157_1_SI_ALB_TIR_016]
MAKRALITGGSKGIGRKTAEYLAAAGCSVVINYRSDAASAELFATELSNRFGVQASAVQGDVSRKEDCENIASFSGEIDILIHNAGPYIKERKPMADYSWDEWHGLISGNLTSVFYLSKLLLPGMKERGWGRLIAFGFDRVETAPAWVDRSAFAAAKTGLASLIKTIALEEASSGITANMICPGDIAGKWKEEDINAAEGKPAPLVPVGRPGTGGDIARVAAFLASEASAFITGAIIPVTGGQDVLCKHFRNGT